jgi:molybdopterin converting factor small subunit
MPTVLLPSVLQQAAGGRRRVEVAGTTVAEALRDLCDRVPALRTHLFTDAGAPRQHVRCALGDRPVRLDAEDPLGLDDEVLVLPAVSGG